ncbi:MAG: hypothetical protein FWE23_10735 [Chitinivibrionia bacterium]|nr:hypothetical protein [Chitinivibrionia bacterium]
MKQLLLILALTTSMLFWAGCSDDNNSGGGGGIGGGNPTVDSWAAANITLRTLADLREFRDSVNAGMNFLNQTIRLASDIELNGNQNNQWVPIGTGGSGVSARQFRGTFDGNRHSISGLFISGDMPRAGLFGVVGEDGQVKNLVVNVNSITITSSSSTRVGGIAGEFRSTRVIENVGVNIRDSISAIASGGIPNVGGLVGSNGSNPININNSYSAGNISTSGETTQSFGGGLIGWSNLGGVINNSFSTANVSVNTTTGSQGAGGLVGFLTGSSSHINNSYAAGAITISRPVHGGMPRVAGGISGTGSSGSLFERVYYNFFGAARPIGNNNTVNVQGITGVYPEQLRQQSTFVGWDFTNVWDISSDINNGLPFLRDLPRPQNNRNTLALLDIIFLANQRFLQDGRPTTIHLHTSAPIHPAVESIVFNGRTLIAGTDYQVQYRNHIDVGRGEIIINGRGNYSESVILPFFITEPRNIAQTVISAIPDQVHTGLAIRPEITLRTPAILNSTNRDTITLREGLDYILDYVNNVEPGRATIEVVGIGIFAGTFRTVNFNIIETYSRTPISGGNATIAVITPVTFNGQELQPTITVAHIRDGVLVQGRDYIVSFSDNINAGTGWVTITGIGNYIGEATAAFFINRRDINEAIIAPIPPQRHAGGEEVRPTLTITDLGRELVLGTDFTVSYLNNRNIGEHAVANITGTRNYTGSRVVNFVIE